MCSSRDTSLFEHFEIIPNGHADCIQCVPALSLWHKNHVHVGCLSLDPAGYSHNSKEDSLQSPPPLFSGTLSSDQTSSHLRLSLRYL